MAYKRALECDNDDCSSSFELRGDTNPEVSSNQVPGSWIHTIKTGDSKGWHHWFCSWACVLGYATSRMGK